MLTYARSAIIFLASPSEKKQPSNLQNPWEGDPGINNQNAQGKAKIYQVKQVLLAIEKLEFNHDTKK